MTFSSSPWVQAARTLAFAFIAITLASTAVLAQDALTPEHVARLASAGSATVSPDGIYVAYTKSVPRIPLKDEDGRAWAELHVLDTRDGSSRPFITGSVNISKLAWTPDGSGITFAAKRGDDEHTGIYRIPVDGGEAHKILSHDADIREYALNPDGRQVAFLAKVKKPEQEEKLAKKGFKQIIYEESARPNFIYIAELDLEGGIAEATRTIELEGSAYVLRWSPVDDRLAVTIATTPLIDDHYMNRRVHVVDGTSGEILAKVENPGKLGDVQWSPDGSHLAMLAGHDIHDPSPGRLMLASSSGGAITDVLPQLFETGAVSSFSWQNAQKILYVAAEGVWTRVGVVGFDGKNDKTLVQTGGAILSGLSVSDDGKTVAMVGDAPDHPREIFVMDRRHKRPTRMTDTNPWLADIRLARQEPLRYAARDGLEIEGILIRPLDEVEGKRYPLVLYVHGGPESHHRNGWLTRYSSPGQMLAAKKVAVFHTNYRGSTGRGVPFSKADHGDFAGREFDDLVDAVDHLIGMGLVDEDKVGVTGGSYGGYATAWLTTYYTERFAAGVMFVGISNNISKFGTSDIPEEMFLVHQRKRTYENWDLFLERSPIYHAGKANTPLLIMHGKDDPRVNVGQSMELYRHVKTRTDTPVRLVLYPGEKHGNAKAAARYDYSLRMMRWFEHYLLGPGGEMPDYPIDYEIEAEEAAPGSPSEANEEMAVGESN